MNTFKRYLLPGLCAILFALLLYSCKEIVGGGDDNELPGFSSTAAPGDSAQALLTSRQFTHLNLEVDYMPGYEPTQQALDSLKSFLQKRLNKSSISIKSPDLIEAGNQNAYSANDIRAIEKENRSHYTNYETAGADTVWTYFVFVDGEFTQENVLGIAYYNTSMAFFGPTIHDNSGGVGQADRYKLEATVFNHEFGHNMGLVANGSPMQENHQDQGNGQHCTEENCLMYYSVRTTDYSSILVDSPIPDLLEYCRADIQANGGS